jgi:membrane-bound serine protease (ClpP class)
MRDSLIPVLAVLGLVGIAVELGVLPGAGVPGSVGLAALLIALALAVVPAPFVAVAHAVALAVLIALGLTLLVVLALASPLGRRVGLRARQGPDYVASPNHESLLGRHGVAVSFLRPAGVATIDGGRTDVLTEGDFIAAGTPVVVTRVEGARIFVRPEVIP